MDREKQAECINTSMQKQILTQSVKTRQTA